MLDIIILAAGKGTRMKSKLPKVLHTIGGEAMLIRVIKAVQNLSHNRIHIVTGHEAEKVEAQLQKEKNINCIQQKNQLGTGHAVQQALPYLNNDSTTLILYGDVPLIEQNTVEKLVDKVTNNTLALLTVKLNDSTGYGRIVRNKADEVQAIVEQKDASIAELDIKEVNTGILAVKSKHLIEWLPKLKNENAQGEFYLTDIIAMAVEEGLKIVTQEPSSEWEVMGVNDRKQQAELERVLQQQIANKQMENGVTLLDPKRFDCRGTLSCGDDVIIDINCVFEGENKLGSGVKIGPNCIIKNAVIGDQTEIKANTIIEEAIIASECIIGPFARLRPGTKISNNAKVGNFVETKKSILGSRSKINHLSYVGDAIVGNDVNIGAGTITCNYDGENKFQTTIEDDVFIGSNTALIAPVTIAKGSTVGAGSIINKKVEKDTLALSRAPQRTISNWQRPVKKPK